MPDSVRSHRSGSNDGPRDRSLKLGNQPPPIGRLADFSQFLSSPQISKKKLIDAISITRFPSTQYEPGGIALRISLLFFLPVNTFTTPLMHTCSKSPKKKTIHTAGPRARRLVSSRRRALFFFVCSGFGGFTLVGCWGSLLAQLSHSVDTLSKSENRASFFSRVRFTLPMARIF